MTKAERSESNKVHLSVASLQFDGHIIEQRTVK